MNNKQLKKILILVVILIAIDQIIKIIFLVTNARIGNGDSWSLGIIEQAKSENNIQYILISIIVILMLIRYITRNNTYIKMASRVVISFAVAGCISNLIDRIWNGGTINYIHIPNFTSLNLGYVYIVATWVGMAVLLTKYTAERIKEKNEKTNNSK